MPVSIFGVIEHEQISASARARAPSASDTTLDHAAHHVFDAALLFLLASPVFIIDFVHRAQVRPPSTKRSRDRYLRSRRRIVRNRMD